MLNNALAGRNRSASDVSRFQLSSVQLRNHEVGYFDPLLWAVRVMICVATFCIGGKCSVVLCLKNRKYGGVSSLRCQEEAAHGLERSRLPTSVFVDQEHFQSHVLVCCIH